MSSESEEDTTDQTILNDFDLCSDIDEYSDEDTTLSGIRDQEKNNVEDQNIPSDTQTGFADSHGVIGPKDSIAGSGQSSQFTSHTENVSAKFVTILKDDFHKLEQDTDDLTQKDKKSFDDSVSKYETKIEEQLKEIQRLLYFEDQHSTQKERIQELSEQLQQSNNAQTELTNKLHHEESNNKSKEEIIQTLRKENSSLKEEKKGLLLRERKSLEDLAGKYETEREGLLKEIQRLLYFEDQHYTQKERLREQSKQLAQSNNAVTELKNKLHHSECENKSKEGIIQALRNDNYSLEEEKQGLLLRLSKVAGAKLTLDNPNIADLSDQKRPTKLAEEFAELYDNEWTDAFEDAKSTNEQEKTTFMLKLLQRASEICSEVSNEHMNGIKRSICTLTVRTNDPTGRTSKMHPGQQHTEPLSGPSSVVLSNPNTGLSVQPENDMTKAKRSRQSSQQENMNLYGSSVLHEVTCDSSNLQHDQKKTIMELRKFIEVSLSDQLEVVVADVIARENDVDKQTEIAVFKYIRKCVNICWSMYRVEPPVFISFPEVQGDLRLDTNVYKAYTKTGHFVDYIVWPALYLHENGPVLCKGVAQGKA